MSGDWRVNKTATSCLEYLCMTDTLADVYFILPKSINTDQDDHTPDPYRGQNTDQKPVPAHRFILAMRSAVFQAMFYGDMKETGQDIRIEDIELEPFKELLRYIYCDTATLDGNNVLQCLHAAKKYCVEGFAKLCSDFLENSIGIENVCTLFNQSTLYGIDDLKDRCLKVMSDNASEVFASSDFLNLSEDALAFLFAGDTLEVNEVDIFEAALRWARKKSEDSDESETDQSGKVLRKTLGKALFNIRFPLMDVTDYTDRVVPSDILTMEEQLQLYMFMTKKDNKQKKTVANFSAASRYTSLLEISMPGTPENMYVVRIKGCVVSFTMNKPVKIHRVLFDQSFKQHVNDMLVEIVSTDGSKLLTYELDSLTPGKIIFSNAIQILAGIQYTLRVKFDRSVSVMSCGTQPKVPFSNTSHGINVSWSSWSHAVKSIYVSKV